MLLDPEGADAKLKAFNFLVAFYPNIGSSSYPFPLLPPLTPPFAGAWLVRRFFTGVSGAAFVSIAGGLFMPDVIF